MKSERLARFILFLLMVAAGFVGVMALGPAVGLAIPGSDPDAVTIHARMPENGGWSSQTLYAEVGQPLHLRLTSDDVLHSFAVGQSALAPIDLKPGEWANTTLTFDHPGRYTFYCTRWCGRDHWRMRGTIIVTGGSAPAAAQNEQPLYLRLGLDIDAPHPAEVIPAARPAADRGAALAARLPAWAMDPTTYQTSSPAAVWQRLRAQSELADLSADSLWDLVAYLWARQTSPAQIAAAQALYATNCAACHGETGRGDGVMVEGLPRYVPGETHSSPTTGTPAAGMDHQTPAMASAGDMRVSAPQDLTDPHLTLGASPAVLEGKLLRGGMGTGMPNWGSIFTQDQLDGLIAYLYTFALNR